VGESFVVGLFQAASDVTDFRLLGSVNAVLAGDRIYCVTGRELIMQNSKTHTSSRLKGYLMREGVCE
jgi:hypothetical protein